MRLEQEFFARPSIVVAPELIGRKLVRQLGNKRYAAMITETGAYKGGERKGLRYGPGEIYVAIFRGGYETLCIGTEAEDIPSVVTIRKGYPLENIQGDLGGSGRLARALQISKQLDEKSIEYGELFIEGNPVDRSKILYISPGMEKMAENCLGYYRIY